MLSKLLKKLSGRSNAGNASKYASDFHLVEERLMVLADIGHIKHQLKIHEKRRQALEDRLQTALNDTDAHKRQVIEQEHRASVDALDKEYSLDARLEQASRWMDGNWGQSSSVVLRSLGVFLRLTQPGEADFPGLDMTDLYRRDAIGVLDASERQFMQTIKQCVTRQKVALVVAYFHQQGFIDVDITARDEKINRIQQRMQEDPSTDVGEAIFEEFSSCFTRDFFKNYRSYALEIVDRGSDLEPLVVTSEASLPQWTDCRGMLTRVIPDCGALGKKLVAGCAKEHPVAYKTLVLLLEEMGENTLERRLDLMHAFRVEVATTSEESTALLHVLKEEKGFLSDDYREALMNIKARAKEHASDDQTGQHWKLMSEFVEKILSSPDNTPTFQ